MNYIDTHFHLDLMENPLEFIEKVETSKTYTIAVTNTPSVFGFTHELTRNKKYVRAALGLHPELVWQRSGELEIFKENLNLTPYIGEIGLDFARENFASKDRQINVFEKIIQLCADAGNKILTLHSRRAEKELIEIIGNNFSGKAILHWYSGSIKNIEKALEYGFYFSINYQMTKSKNGQAIIKSIPLERMLTESDGPFVWVDEQVSTPINMDSTCLAIDNVLGIECGKAKEAIFVNFSKLIHSNAL